MAFVGVDGQSDKQRLPRRTPTYVPKQPGAFGFRGIGFRRLGVWGLGFRRLGVWGIGVLGCVFF